MQMRGVHGSSQLLYFSGAGLALAIFLQIRLDTEGKMDLVRKSSERRKNLSTHLRGVNSNYFALSRAMESTLIVRAMVVKSYEIEFGSF